MGIRSTRYISRCTAINRIIEVDKIIAEKHYRKLDSISSEHDVNLANFVNSTTPLNTNEEDLDKWTDEMLADKMDEPFYRFSMFDNYLIKDDEEDDDY
jgi:peptidoglycan hydrolase CwlO-like protein